MKKRSKGHIHTVSYTEREAFLHQANEAYTAMKKDPKQWQEHLEEIAIWESTLDDGLEDE